MLLSFGNLLALAPLWAIGLFIFAGMFGAALLAGILRRRRDRNRVEGDSATESSEQSLTISAVMGLLALLVAFTFSIALDRFDARRVNVLNESNAIGTTYLRAQMLDEPYRARMSQLLTRYTDTRVAVATLDPGPRQKALLAESDQLLVDLWSETVAAFPSIKGSSFAHSFLDTMNQMIDMDATRKAGRQAHVPAVVFLVLFVFLLVSVGLISYVIVGKRSRHTAWVLFGLFGMMLVLIVDVDRPTSGGIIESQEPMLQLQAFLKANPPGAFQPR